MTTLQQIQLVAACSLAAIAYMAPTLVALIRLSPATSRALLLNACFGWTIVGWVLALRLAWRRSPRAPFSDSWSAWRPGRPEAASASRPGGSTYVDGSYLISEEGGARTWAVCRDGRWGIAYELDGIQRTAAWVDSSDVPLSVLADALSRIEEWRR